MYFWEVKTELLGSTPLMEMTRVPSERKISLLQQAPAAVERLLTDPDRFRAKMRELRDTMVFRLGHSIPAGAGEIARLADEKAQARRAAEDE